MSIRMAVRGEFRIDPPLKWPAIKDSAYLANGDGAAMTDIILRVDAEESDTEDGIHTVITSSRVVPWTSAPYDPRNLLSNIKDLQAECTGHVIQGQMVLYDVEMPGYITRVILDEAGPREERARLVWPDGSEAEPLD
ncbi:DUF6205 family protein [Streptomyces sp. NEAU-Y11]|uniref:DUF6205 family protein n=1 Tax=Streptomyces cucumeris TaxID=2962890 RepID=UPI0020C87A22|nr:DUF6205 family protein [Streptomyces sp. NEAU-Y11]MCP9209671.1 hypothetical protein [Streptomyces sp. NEAU-Y11]